MYALLLKYFKVNLRKRKRNIMNIEKTLNEISNYFESKIINGDFEFISCGEYVAKVMVDDKYNLDLWIANNPKNNFRFYFNLDNVFQNSFKSFETEKARLDGWNALKPFVKKYKEEELRLLKQKEIEKLTKEIESL